MKKLLLLALSAIIIISAVKAWNNPDVRGYINERINKIEGKTLNREFSAKIKSGNLTTDYTIEEALSDIDKFQLNTVNVPVVVNIDSLSSNDMSISADSEKRAISLIKKLRWKKINVILEPYPWIKNGSLYETEWRPTDINAFFWNWKTKVLKELIDDVAVPYHVDALNVASNFMKIEYAQGYWCDTIDFVRQYYKGLVTYMTGWWYTAQWSPETYKAYEDKLNNELFSKVDFISVSAYFELTDHDSNSVESLIESIHSTQIFNRKQDIEQELKNFNDKWHKPIFFGELGFPKRNKASVQPWNPYISDIRNDTEQANCFAAYRKVFENEQWLLGFSIFAVGQHGEDKNYYPSDESAKILRDWYHLSK